MGKGPGRAVLTVRWPARASARLVPNAANSIVVNLLQGATVVASRTIPRPADGAASTSATLTGLAYGAYGVQVGAFPGADGSGVSQAGGAGTMTVTEDVPGSLSVAMGSNVAALAITPASPVVGIGGTTTLAASATDASGAIVLLAAGGGSEPITWTSDAPSVATVAGIGPTATLTGGASVGTANVTASLRVDDASDVKTAAAPVSVVSALILAPVASGYVVTDGGTYYSTGTDLIDGSASVRPGLFRFDKWIAEYDLSSLPAGAVVTSATFSANLVSHPHTATSHAVESYAGDGALTTGDYTASGTPIGTVDGTANGAKTIDATSAVSALIASGSRYAGMRVSLTVNGGISYWSSPTLRIEYRLGP